jgi:hypothetical protein
VPIEEIIGASHRDPAEATNGICYFGVMARLPRVVVVDVPHHITQRGK